MPKKKVLPKPIAPPKERVTMTLEAWRAEATKRFGPRGQDWRFKCAMCGQEQSFQDFLDAGMTPEEAQSRAHFSCLGRWVTGRGCDWTLGGLFRIHTVEVETPDGKKTPVFEFADPKPVEAANAPAS